MSQQIQQKTPTFTTTSPAKLNLCLDIIKKDPSGYHKIQTVFYELKSLEDRLSFFEIPQGCNVSILNEGQKSTYTKIPKEENLAYRALKLLKRRFGIRQSMYIEIHKKIPLASGLGGGSSNAAATLKALNKVWNLGLTSSELRKLAAELGMDVPFFIDGGVALGTSYGEKITQLPDIVGIDFQVSPRAGQGTQEAFGSLDLEQCGHSVLKTESLIEAIKNQDNEGILQNIHNDFETIFPQKAAIHLSGSGPSTFSAHLLK